MTGVPLNQSGGLLRRLWNNVRPVRNSESLTSAPISDQNAADAAESERSNHYVISTDDLIDPLPAVQELPEARTEPAYTGPPRTWRRTWRRSRLMRGLRQVWHRVNRLNPMYRRRQRENLLNAGIMLDSMSHFGRGARAPPAPVVTRSCGVCLETDPTRRAVFTSCGHAACLECAQKLADDATTADEISCPFCRAVTGFVPLFEDSQ